jgi:hypothetical protein
VKDSASQLRIATRRAKSDVANKLVSMFLHELSRKISQGWPIRVDSQEYGNLVRGKFNNHCPYCSCDLATTVSVKEHLDGMNRLRGGLHVPGNVLMACKRCNNEKRRDDSLKFLSLAPTGWESFLSHDGSRCSADCPTCRYWESIWEDREERTKRLSENLRSIRAFRDGFREFQRILPKLKQILPEALTILYSNCQKFAETEIKSLLEGFQEISDPGSSSDHPEPRKSPS